MLKTSVLLSWQAKNANINSCLIARETHLKTVPHIAATRTGYQQQLREASGGPCQPEIVSEAYTATPLQKMWLEVTGGRHLGLNDKRKRCHPPSA